MNCFECERPSVGMCHFCSRGVCKDHYREGLFIQNLAFDQQKQEYLGLVTKKALRCSLCEVVEELVRVKVQ